MATTTDDGATVVSMDGVDADLAVRHMRGLDEHRVLVGVYLMRAIQALTLRSILHDRSKLSDDEFWAMARQLPGLEHADYGSPEYIACMRAIKPALKHHFAVNSHHPEFFGEAGVDGMTLIDLLEMVCDWMAACQRNAEPGEATLRLDKNRERYHLDDRLAGLIRRTVEFLRDGDDLQVVE